jgi:hypothetical protein
LITVENVRYLTVKECRSLTNVHLNGVDYISVFLDLG